MKKTLKEKFIESRGFDIPFTDQELKDPSKINPKSIAERIECEWELFDDTLKAAWKKLLVRSTRGEIVNRVDEPYNTHHTLLEIRRVSYLPDLIEEWVEERKNDPLQLVQDLRRGAGGSTEFREEICEWLGKELFSDWDILKKYIPNGLLGFSNEDLDRLIERWVWLEEYDMRLE